MSSGKVVVVPSRGDLCDDFTTIALSLDDAGVIHEVSYLGGVHPKMRCIRARVDRTWNHHHPSNADKPNHATCLQCVVDGMASNPP